jgi:hypothetical protein
MSEVILCDAESGDPAPAIVIEVAHRTLRFDEWQERFSRYSAGGVGEYYLIHPEWPMDIEGWCRDGDRLAPIRDMTGWVSPRLGFRFVLDKGELTVFGPDGRQLLTPAEIAAERDAAEQRAEAERQRAERLAAKLRELGIDPDAV